jgi:hypothetical protein
VVHQVAVNPAISVLEWMDVDEPESKYRGSDNSIQTFTGSVVECNQTVDE